MDREEFIKTREKYGYSKKDFANILGVDPSYVSLIETGERPVSDSIRYKIEKMEQHFAMEKPEPYNVTKVIDRKPGRIAIFNVDATMTPIEVFNDQTTIPSYYIEMPAFSDCEFGINVYGHSMYPTIESGMVALCKELRDKSVIAYGEIYFIVTKDFRMVKRILKSERKGYIIASSDNHNGHASPDGKTYAPMEIHLDKIMHIYMVKGCFKRYMI